MSENGEPADAGQVPLVELVERIKFYLRKVDDSQATLAHLLAEARKRIVEKREAGRDVKWKDWLAENFKFGERHARRLISFVGGNPEETLARIEADRAGKRERMNTLNKTRKQLLPPPNPVEIRPEPPEPPIDSWHAARTAVDAIQPLERRIKFLAELFAELLTEDDRAKFAALLRGVPAEDRVATEHVEAPKDKAAEPPKPKPEAPKPPRKSRKPKAIEQSATRPALAPGLVKAAPTVAGKPDLELMAHLSYPAAVELFESEADRAAALEFARTTYRRKKSGEAPKEMTAWQTHCWQMPDDVRGCFVRHTQAQTQPHA